MAYRPPSRPALGRFTTASGITLGVAGGIANFTVAGGHPLVLATSAVGLACIPVGLAVCYGGAIYDWFKDQQARHIEITTCKAPEDMQAVYELAVSKFGEGVTPPDQIQGIQNRYRDSLKVAHWVGGKEPRELCGYYITFPMNKRLVDKIHYDRFNVTDIDATDIPERPRYAYATYIGGIVGVGGHAKAELTGALKAELAMAARTKSGRVYARAATKEGLRVLTRNGFAPVFKRATGLDCYYYRDLHADASHGRAAQRALRFAMA